MSKNGDESIKVVDRRRFTDDGDEREDAPEDVEREEAGSAVQDAPGQEAGSASPTDPGAGALPQVDFVTFILSLSQTAVISLGLGPEMGDGQAPPLDLQSAKWTIDALDMLHKKTQGNLTGEEERIFDRILAELKMAFVQVSGAVGGNVK